MGRACEQVGRDRAEVQLTMLCTLLFDASSERPGVLSGSTDRLIDQLGEYADVGVQHVVLFVQAHGGVQGRLDALRRFAGEVAPQFA